ncbi:amino acid adenylation domain-containing protein [Streptomyces sp. NPDC002619]|uniref:non-ribosomal peptide synthetase n=1 Tax=Streptomyces sp. NPDC002619 TaxID=3364655 RepID=UPI0036B0D412
MGVPVEADREFWGRVLTAGGFTAVPRWVREPVAGVAEYEAAVPDDVLRAVRELAHELRVPASAVLLAAHAKVLAALSGEQDVVTGYHAGERGDPLPCRLTVVPGSWRALVSAVGDAEAELLAHRAFPVAELRRELTVAGPSYEVVFDPADTEGGLADDAVLGVGWSDEGGRTGLRLRYRKQALDAGCAARIGGYHLAALRLMAADADAEHTTQSLLSADEVGEQLEGLAGPRRTLPRGRVHELFEERVRAHPEAVAAVHGDQQWTYGQLNAHANQLARALLDRGLSREDVVAVVTERDLDWLAAVLAVFKAGGAYLPIEPHFPPERVRTTLSRAGCRIVLTEPGSTGSLDQALTDLPGVEKLLIKTAYAEGHADTDVGVEVASAQLAYIYFTSGSTGEPKGAMCEHVGMLNHLFAKIDDLGITEGAVVAQTAPQCFDISLWQLVSALLVGGRTLLVEQDAIVDVERFVDTLRRGRAAVVQVVPSYLDVVVSYLERHPRELPDLRCVSVTGEALKRELVQRWFAVRPGTRLVNAYGLTETSDDTNHEVMDTVPERVLLGRAVNNVHVYVVDEQLSLVPLGAPGLIAFSGVCVGRGYVNDPERTREAYREDPYRPGERLYLGGDWGRWHPDGKLEFLGRRDNQVKIRGFRIEIGEIENTLLRVPGVRDGAVVVAEGPDHSPHLIAYYTGERHPVDVLRGELGAALPVYMVPSAFHWRHSLPLTANGKTDRKALTALAEQTATADTTPEHDRALSPTERKLAAAWAELLGVPEHRIGRADHFFDSGGTSLSAVKLTIALDRAVSLKDITRHPVLADLAALLDGATTPRTELLQPLAEADGTLDRALVCFPYAGGNAVNYQPMAGALARRGTAVYAVDLPGHDLAAHNEPFAPLAQVVEQVVAEITARGLTRVMLWGHSSGAAPALATARALQERGVDVPRVYVAAQLPGTAAGRRAALADLTARGNAEIAARLTEDSGYTELGELDAQHAEHIGAAYRHDCVCAHRYFAEALEAPPELKLAAPLTVVVAADDPSTAGYADQHRDWQLFAEHVDLHELADGGHYFLRTRPADAARVVLTTAAPLASS